MKEIKLKSFWYKCNCGYELTVSIDFGTPQEHFKCRRCGDMVRRNMK